MNMNNKNNDQRGLRQNHTFCRTVIHFALLAGTFSVQARDYFNPALLDSGVPGQPSVDLSPFEEAGGQVPGVYRVDVYLNNERMETRDVEFRAVADAEGQTVLQPCLSAADLTGWGVMTTRFPELNRSGEQCVNLAAVPQSSATFRFSEQQLLLSFPQSAVVNAARGWVDPALWDEGITAALLNYNVSGANNWARKNQGSDSNSQYVNLRPGINIGPWRLRNYTTWNRSSDGNQTQDKWDTVYTYAQRDIKTLKSQLTLGDSTTPSDVFDSVPFRGGQLASDDEMLPESLRGYAPVVRGIARTNAQVTIRQNGYIIYQTYVSPGSFEITDMYPTGGSGDLHVTIQESDGSEQQLVIPYASLPVLQREGRLKYSITSGVYRAYDNSIDETPITQGTAIYGLPLGFTAYGGVQASSKYQSVAAGVGKNLGQFGALSADVTQAWSHQKDQKKEEGQSWRIRYSKNIVETGTNFALAGYRYATDGYWNMQEVLETYRSGENTQAQQRRRNRAEITLSQNLWQEAGNLSLTAIREDYWNSNKRMESYGASYNNAYNGISFGLSYTYSRNSWDTSATSNNRRQSDNDQLFSVNVSVPLEKLFGNHSTYVNYSMNSSKNGTTNQNVSLSGTLLEDNNLSWSMMQGYGSQGEGNSGGINADWRATYGELSSGYSYDKYNQRLNYAAQGSIVAHENGLTFGQPLGETAILVAAPGAGGVGIQGQTGVKTDFRGYTLVPYASPYRKNDVVLNTETLGEETEVALSSQTVIPTRGAIVRASYQTSVGYRALMTLVQTNGRPVPFGATVKTSQQSSGERFIVGDNGQVYLTGLENQGQLLVKWGEGADERCSTAYSVPENNEGILTLSGQCR